MRITLNELRELVREALIEAVGSEDDIDIDILQQIVDYFEATKARVGRGWRLKEKEIVADVTTFADSLLAGREVIAIGVPAGEVKGTVTRVDLRLDPLKRVVIDLSVLPDGGKASVRVNKATSITGGGTWKI